MKFTNLLILSLTLIIINIARAQDHTDAVIVGHVVSKGEHIPFVNVFLEGTLYGTATDLTGHYMIVDVPEGEFTIVAKMIGYKTKKIPVTTRAGETVEIKFDLEEDIIHVDEVVITGTKTF
jgi:outer membrane receptor for ferrienterochelin and colicins